MHTRRYLIALSLASSGCLVLSLAPLYDSESMGYDARLIGSWIDQDDNASMEVGRAEWQSYRIHYVHPIETGDLTGYLTALGEDRYLDLMPGRGAEVSPAHANWIVNAGEATARDLLELVEIVRAAVVERFGIRLEMEVKVVGEDQ